MEAGLDGKTPEAIRVEAFASPVPPPLRRLEAVRLANLDVPAYAQGGLRRGNLSPLCLRPSPPTG